MTDEFYKKVSCEAIRNYLRVKVYLNEDINSKYYLEEMWSDEFIEKYYNLALTLIVENYKSYRDKTEGLNISNISQGSQSISFNNSNGNNLINEDVELLLPRPKNVFSW